MGGWDTEKQVLNVIEAAIKRRVPSKLESDMIKAQREYQMRAIGFENNGAFEIQRQNIAKAALMQRVALPLVGVTSMADQSVRIDAMEPFINDAFAPRILFFLGWSRYSTSWTAGQNRRPGTTTTGFAPCRSFDDRQYPRWFLRIHPGAWPSQLCGFQ
ncbi:hypothetical protein P4200_02395 [Pseudomonas aeruginosa]|nr:hypothetical protein [Pseudomonas aeruginosa]